ncbi:DUF3857 domain-containing protein [Acidobacterium sp. S8]|uniref:DUF3857 domain-containing protein n=1 Tax=Acidobacterium sp. S8 TaxID=1641854 RepID=UPI00131B6F2F|nr:DUF3857 domain-containing protein [Acidobacterium sp. S8]
MRVHLAAVFLLLATYNGMASSPALPDWMQQAAAIPVTNSLKAKAVVLLSDELLTIQPDGQARLRRREVIKLLRPQGREYAELVAWSGGGRKRLSFHAWSIGPDGHPYTVKDDQIREEGGEEGGMLYIDDRAKVVTPPGADPGGIVAYESESQLPNYMTEKSWDFQTSIPVQHAIFEIDLPAGWKQRPLWHNHTSIPPQEISPGHFRWELTGIPAIDIDDVPLAPAEIALAGRMVVHYGANNIAEVVSCGRPLANGTTGSARRRQMPRARLLPRHMS